jgi:hypothetical protein
MIRSNLIHYLLCFLLVSLAASSCGAARHVSPTVTDSTRVEVHTVTETVHDTAYIELPVIVERIVTRDTTSTLENDYARSEASVENGFLHHSLETKPVKHPVQIETKIVYRDSLIYRDRVETKTVEVECQLTKWQSFKMRTGGATLTLLLLAIVTAALYLFLHFKNPFKL